MGNLAISHTVYPKEKLTFNQHQLYIKLMCGEFLDKAIPRQVWYAVTTREKGEVIRLVTREKLIKR